MSRYPHDWSIDALSCRACGVPRLHADPSAPCVAALVARVTELERHVGSIDAGVEALLRDCRAHLALALRAAEAEAYPGHGWRRAARDTVSVLDGVLGVERGDPVEGE